LTHRVRPRGHPDCRPGQVSWAITGGIILDVAALIPFVGGIVAGLAISAGFGGAAELWKRLRTA
jgi:hypothetical protein